MSYNINSEEKDYAEEDKKVHWPAFMCLGVSLGGVLGAVFKNIAIGSGIGMVLGILIRIYIANANRNK